MRDVYRDASKGIGLAAGFFMALFLGIVLVFVSIILVRTWFPPRYIKNVGSIEMTTVLNNAIRTYYLEHEYLPPTDERGYLQTALTTPVNYVWETTQDQVWGRMNELPIDPFNSGGPWKQAVWFAPARRDFSFRFTGPTYRLVVPPAGVGDAFVWGLGSDGDADFSIEALEEGTFEEARAKFGYDPSNGALSGGDVIRGLYLGSAEAEDETHSD